MLAKLCQCRDLGGHEEVERRQEGRVSMVLGVQALGRTMDMWAMCGRHSHTIPGKNQTDFFVFKRNILIASFADYETLLGRITKLQR